jgi:hypothetical protein
VPDRLERAIVRYRVQAAHNLLDEAFGASSPDIVAHGVILPLFARLEETGDPGVVRFASSLFEIRLLAQAGGWERIDGPLVVLACAPREEHTLGLISLGLGLAARHCRVAYLGATTPVWTLEATVREHDVALTVVSAERDDLADDERECLRALEPLLIGRAAASLAASLGTSVAFPDGEIAAVVAHRSSPRRDDAASPPHR